MPTTTEKRKKRCKAWISLDEGLRCRQVDEIVVTRNGFVTKRVTDRQLPDEIYLGLARGPEEKHTLEVCFDLSVPQKKPASSGLSVVEKFAATAVVAFATFGAFVTVAALANALN